MAKTQFIIQYPKGYTKTNDIILKVQSFGGKNMSNRLFQGIIHQMHDTVDRVIGVIDDAGYVIACSELNESGQVREKAKEEMLYTTDNMTLEGYTYQHIGSGAKPEYMIFVEGEDKTAEKFASILAIALSNI